MIYLQETWNYLANIYVNAQTIDKVLLVLCIPAFYMLVREVYINHFKRW